MKLEFEGLANFLKNEGVRALAIVLGVIVVIAGIVYVANFGKRKKSIIVPTKTLKEVTVTPQPTITPLIEETPSASPSPTRKVLRSTGTPTPAVKGVTVTPTPTI